MIRIDAGVVCMLSLMCLATPSIASAVTQDETDAAQGEAEKTSPQTRDPAPTSQLASEVHAGDPLSSEEESKSAGQEGGPSTTPDTSASHPGQAKANSDPEEAVQTPPADSVMDTIVSPLMTTGAGLGSVLTGLGIGLWGLRPLMQFYQLQAALQAEESRASADPAGATQNALMFQAMAYGRNREWKMFGLPMVVGGTLLTLGGTVFIGSGVMGLAWGWTGENE